MAASRVKMTARTRVVTAVIAGESSAMDGAALAIKIAAKGIAARHRLTGAYMNAIQTHEVRGERGTGRQVKDRVVSATDPGSMSIEFGRLYRHEGSRRVTWVPGQKIMTQAARSVS